MWEIHLHGIVRRSKFCVWEVLRGNSQYVGVWEKERKSAKELGSKKRRREGPKKWVVSQSGLRLIMYVVISKIGI